MIYGDTLVESRQRNVYTVDFSDMGVDFAIMINWTITPPLKSIPDSQMHQK